MKTIEVVAGVITNDQGLILAVQRGEHVKPYISKKWEFPGGKIEVGELREEALKRELAEELSVEVHVASLITTVHHSYPDFHLIMHAYHCTVQSGVVQLTEHIDNKWLEVADLSALDWAAADVPVVEVVQNRINL